MPKSKNKGQPVHNRSKYVDHSLRFVDWVNGIGIEKTIVGRLAQMIDRRFNVRRLALLFLFCLGLSFLLTFDTDFVYTGFREGDIASGDVKSPLTFDFVDEIETKRKRLDAENTVPLVFDLDVSMYDDITNGIYRGFREMRRLLANQPWPRGEGERLEAIKSFAVNKPRFEQVLGQTGINESTFE
ncbi:MAG TPA: HD family phosphohydrolase, partial [Bdellovibrionales bacterium]|nr:HD family phosphohydrolase [Bdellovibrionales bacterium]